MQETFEVGTPIRCQAPIFRPQGTDLELTHNEEPFSGSI
jgi:hypothetical protein